MIATISLVYVHQNILFNEILMSSKSCHVRQSGLQKFRIQPTYFTHRLLKPKDADGLCTAPGHENTPVFLF